jgi:uncharacterized RDD family membrane protein YckC
VTAVSKPAAEARAPGPLRGVRLWPRFAAGAFDWLVASFTAWLGALAALGFANVLDLGGSAQTVLVWVFPAAGAAAYFAALLPTGRTLGMRFNGLRIVVAPDGARLSRRRAAARAAAAGLSGAAWLLLLAWVFSDTPEGGYSTGQIVVTALAAVVAVVALLGHFTQLADRSRRCLQDRLFGLAVVDERDVADWRRA